MMIRSVLFASLLLACPVVAANDGGAVVFQTVARVAVGADGQPLDACLVTQHLRFSLPYRAVFSQRMRPDTARRTLDAEYVATPGEVLQRKTVNRCAAGANVQGRVGVRAHVRAHRDAGDVDALACRNFPGPAARVRRVAWPFGGSRANGKADVEQLARGRTFSRQADAPNTRARTSQSFGKNLWDTVRCR